VLDGKQVFLVLVNPDKGQWNYGHDARDPVAFVEADLHESEIGWTAGACQRQMREGETSSS